MFALSDQVLQAPPAHDVSPDVALQQFLSLDAKPFLGDFLVEQLLPQGVQVGFVILAKFQQRLVDSGEVEVALASAGQLDFLGKAVMCEARLGAHQVFVVRVYGNVASSVAGDYDLFVLSVQGVCNFTPKDM